MKEKAFPEQEPEAFHHHETQLGIAEIRGQIEDAMRDVEVVRQLYAQAQEDLVDDQEGLAKAEEELEKLYRLLKTEDVHSAELGIAFEDVRRLRGYVRSSVEGVESGKRMLEDLERSARNWRESSESHIRSLLEIDAEIGRLDQQARKFPRNQA